MEEDTFVKDWLLAFASDLIENNELDLFYKLVDLHPEIADIDNSLSDENDVDFLSTAESFENLKQRLIDEGLWRGDK